MDLVLLIVRCSLSLKATFSDMDSRIVALSLLSATVASAAFRKGFYAAGPTYLTQLGILLLVDGFLPRSGSSSYLNRLSTVKRKLDRAFSLTFPEHLKVALVGPLSEEIFFRGLLQPFLISRIGTAAGIALSSIAFGLLHFQKDVFQISPYTPTLFTAVAGAINGTLAHRVSFWAAVGAHVWSNAIGLFIAPLLKNFDLAKEPLIRRQGDRESPGQPVSSQNFNLSLQHFVPDPV